ncbi:ABC transporter E family member 2 [Pyrus ussuriensis x Pyrus communis]|uniref:ABC transporter E family member 2 n=2 Tax=Magnoliopsida TaxID=3398 RepID=A0A5N5I6I0_9ROSA|nr:ABC transporter E family member 2 [Pyrus ussuriensis x Pyrus communis]
MTISEDEDESLAHFLESEVLSEVSEDKEEEEEDDEVTEEPKAKKMRLVDDTAEKDPQFQKSASSSGFVQSKSAIGCSSNSGNSPVRIETGIFSKIPPELFPHILKFLSSEDLFACSLVCRFLSHVASDESLWRRLYCMRWGHLPPSRKLRECPWKKLYIQRDEEDTVELVRNCTLEFKEYFIQMQAAKRSQAPLPSQVNDDIILDTTVADQVSIWKSRRGLTDKAEADHACSGEKCTYYQIGDVFVCENTGQVHVCDDNCREVVMDPTNELWVCTISGHCFDRLLSPEETESDAEQQQGAVTDEAEPFMGSGRFARAYMMGYNCVDEKELEDALRIRLGEEMADRLTRIAIVSSDRCKPKKCRQECKKSCPVVKTGKLCIEVTPASKIAFISEELCIGCGICVKKCPFEAIQIINLPKDLDKDTTHRYGPNTFKLHRLPVPRPGQVLGLVGTNGIGKSTALKVLAGKLKPNLGRFKNPPDWQEILTYFRGSELQNYFTRILEDNLKAIIKPQYVDHIPKAVQGNVGEVLNQKDERDMKEELCADLELNQVIERNVGDLSGGELQRFAIAVVAIQNAEIYMFDEPSSYLDVKQRLKAAQVVRSLLRANSYVIVVEHDLSVLDYLSDFICCLYGKPGAYGVVTLPFSVREGINIFLAGFVPTENLRFRDESLTFKVAETPQESAEEIETYARYRYPSMSKTQGNFRLRVVEGEFTDSQIIVMLGENGTGKTTFIRMLAGLLKPDSVENSDVEIPEFNVSYKPQKISPKFQSTVRHLLHSRIRDSYTHPQFMSDVMKPLLIEQLMDQEVVNLSGGELQRVALCLCLGKPADIYLIDEPSAYLDSEQRIVASKVIKRFILHAKKTAFVVEHDFIMATYLADRVIVYEGKPSIDCTANCPQSLLTGMNLFLSHLDITFRRDPTNYRPRINKLESTKDREQKAAGSYYYLDD